eukprot:superscaffoldBa00008508_g23405
MHHKITKAMYSKGKEYMDHMEHLQAKMVKPLSCRLEQTLHHLIGVLRSSFENGHGQGNYDDAWRVYQAEFALKELIYSQPEDNKLTMSLGTSASHAKSLTKMRGFLGLAPHSAATSDEVQLWMVLLGDVYGEPNDIPLASMKAVQFPDKVAGALTVDKFLEMVTTQKAFPFPGTFDKARDLVTRAGLDSLNCLRLGLEEMKLYWMVSRLAVIRSHILQEVERQGLYFPSKLDCYREQGMPWLEKCLVWLPNKMDHGEKLKALMFLSCIAFIENGDYVDFKALQDLMLTLPLEQSKMQELRIQSRHSRPKVRTFMVWCLHDDIPCRVAKPETCLSSTWPQAKKPHQEEPEEEPEDIQVVDEEDRPAEVKMQILRITEARPKRLRGGTIGKAIPELVGTELGSSQVNADGDPAAGSLPELSVMVFESLVSDLLNRFIGDYVENLDKSQLKIGIWGGNVVLENLKVKENALVSPTSSP